MPTAANWSSPATATDANAPSVLIVDDDPDILAALGELLESEGYQVTMVTDARAALSHLRDGMRPCVILLDLMMPNMDGFEFLYQLRANPDWRGIPTVVITAKELTPEERFHLTGSVEKILSKGAFTRDELLSNVRELIKRI